MHNILPELDIIRSLHYDMEMGMEHYDNIEVRQELTEAIGHMKAAMKKLEELRAYHDKLEELREHP